MTDGSLSSIAGAALTGPRPVLSGSGLHVRRCELPPGSSASALLAPDLAQTRRFLEVLDPAEVFTFQTFSDRDELKKTFIGRDGRSRTWDPFAKVLHGTLDEHAQELTQLNQQGAGVFVMVNAGDGAIKAGRKTCRTNDNVVGIRALWVDLDGAPLDPVLAAPRPADLIVESSPERWHAYWLATSPLEDFAATQQALAERFNGDPSVTDLARVMRLPGFYHQKTDSPFMTRLIRPE
jgi:hypothetical protein